MSRRALLKATCEKHGVLAVYIFGSRAAEGHALLDGTAIAAKGSDLDVGVVFDRHDFQPGVLAALQLAMEDVFEPLRVDLVPLQRVDAIFQYRAIDGHRVFDRDSTRTALYELKVMREAADLLPIQRRIEIDTFGVSTT